MNRSVSSIIITYYIYLIIVSIFLAIYTLFYIFIPIQFVYADDYSDGQTKGENDAARDCQGANGHGFDDSVHHGSADYQAGYKQGYNEQWKESCKDKSNDNSKNSDDISKSVGEQKNNDVSTLTTSSDDNDYSKGESKGTKYADCDFKNCRGHGFDDSVHHGSADYQAGYEKGYNTEWNRLNVNSLEVAQKRSNIKDNKVTSLDSIKLNANSAIDRIRISIDSVNPPNPTVGSSTYISGTYNTHDLVTVELDWGDDRSDKRDFSGGQWSMSHIYNSEGSYKITATVYRHNIDTVNGQEAPGDTHYGISRTLDIQKITNPNTDKPLPIADAGTDQTVKESDSVHLDGSNSKNPLCTDPVESCSSPLVYHWKQIDTSDKQVSLDVNDDSRAAKPKFDAPHIDKKTLLRFELVVNYGDIYSNPSYVTIGIEPVVNPSQPSITIDKVSSLKPIADVDSVTASGSITKSPYNAAYTVTVNWGDGSTPTQAEIFGDPTWTATHKYSSSATGTKQIVATLHMRNTVDNTNNQDIDSTPLTLEVQNNSKNVPPIHIPPVPIPPIPPIHIPPVPIPPIPPIHIPPVSIPPIPPKHTQDDGTMQKLEIIGICAAAIIAGYLCYQKFKKLKNRKGPHVFSLDIRCGIEGDQAKEEKDFQNMLCSTEDNKQMKEEFSKAIDSMLQFRDSLKGGVQKTKELAEWCKGAKEDPNILLSKLVNGPFENMLTCAKPYFGYLLLEAISCNTQVNITNRGKGNYGKRDPKTQQKQSICLEPSQEQQQQRYVKFDVNFALKPVEPYIEVALIQDGLTEIAAFRVVFKITTDVNAKGLQMASYTSEVGNRSIEINNIQSLSLDLKFFISRLRSSYLNGPKELGIEIGKREFDIYNEIICPKCNKRNHSESKFCIHCGLNFVQSPCVRCGNVNSRLGSPSSFCSQCGFPLR